MLPKADKQWLLSPLQDQTESVINAITTFNPDKHTSADKHTDPNNGTTLAYKSTENIKEPNQNVTSVTNPEVSTSKPTSGVTAADSNPNDTSVDKDNTEVKDRAEPTTINTNVSSSNSTKVKPEDKTINIEPSSNATTNNKAVVDTTTTSNDESGNNNSTVDNEVVTGVRIVSTNEPLFEEDPVLKVHSNKTNTT